MATSKLVTREDLKNVFSALGEGDYSTRIDNLENNIGTIYTASWQATSSAANSVILTETLTLPKGTYVVVASLPPTNGSTTMAFGLYDTVHGFGDSTSGYRYITVAQNHYAVGVWIVENPNETAMGMNLRSAGSASVTYTASYGKLRAIRIGV